MLAGFVLGEVWIWQFGGTAAYAALICAAMINIMIGMFKRGSFYFFLTAIGIGMILGGSQQKRWMSYETSIDNWAGEGSCRMEGQVEEILEKEYSFALVIDNIRINGETQGGKLLLYLKEKTDCTIGCRIRAEGQIEEFARPTNPGGFDQRQYRAGQGILGVIYDTKLIEVRYGSFLVKHAVWQIRQRCVSFLCTHMDKEWSGIGIAMALGDKSRLTQEQKGLYETAGISHVLAVSGLHMSLLGAGIYKIFRKAGVGYGVSVISSLPCILFYAFLTGMSSSCLRAAIMLMIYLIGEYRGYTYDLLSSLSLAGLWLLSEIPARLLDSGFLLSFAAMISVGVVSPVLFRMFQYKTGKHKLLDSFLSGLLITLLTLPLSLYFFYGISLAGVGVNLIVIPLMSGLVPFLFLGSLGWTPFLPAKAAVLLLKPEELILQLYDSLCRAAENISFSYMQIGFRGFGFLAGYYGILAIFLLILYWTYRKSKIYIIMTISFLSLSVCMWIHVTGRNDSYLTFLDVGQGDGILYHSKEDEVCLIDGGSTSEKNLGQYVIRPALEYYGISRVHYWFVSHFDEDHISGMLELLESGYPIEHVILPYRRESAEKQQQIEALAWENGTEVHYMKQGDQLCLKDSIFTCLYPQKDQTGDENQNSLVLLLETDKEQILLTGDIEKEGEQKMSQYLKRIGQKKTKYRILKTAHHGSANGTSEEFLKIYRPDTAIISCGQDNSYGHPAKETVERLQDWNSRILYTMEQGAVEIRCGRGIAVFTPSW